MFGIFCRLVNCLFDNLINCIFDKKTTHSGGGTLCSTHLCQRLAADLMDRADMQQTDNVSEFSDGPIIWCMVVPFYQKND